MLLSRALLFLTIAAQQSGEQFRVLCADHHLKFTCHPVQVVRAKCVLVCLPPIGVHLFRFCFLAGVICRGAFTSSRTTRRVSPPFEVSAWIRPVIVHVQRPRRACGLTRADAREAMDDGRSPRVMTLRPSV